MEITKMKDFQEICKQSLVEIYKDIIGKRITLDNTFIVWSCKTLLKLYKTLSV